jgi:hypothetical protein
MEASDLPDFEGTEVVEARAVVRNAGDGLSEAMHFAPFAVHQGDKRYLVLDTTCIDVQHPYADKKNPEDGLARVHILRADTGLFLDAEFIAEAVKAQEAKIADFRAAAEKARKEAKGEFGLPFGEDGAGASITELPVDPE